MTANYNKTLNKKQGFKSNFKNKKVCVSKHNSETENTQTKR